MADFELEIALTPLTADLEAKMKEAEQAVSDAASGMENAANKAGDGLEGAGKGAKSFTDKAAKALVVVGALDAGFKVATAGVNIFKGALAAANGDAEGTTRALEEISNLAKSLPFGLGQLASSIEGFFSAIMGVEEAQAAAREAERKAEEGQRKLDNLRMHNEMFYEGNSALRDRLALLNSENEFARRHNELTQERFRLEEELQELIAKANEDAFGKNTIDQDMIRERLRLIDAIIEKEKQLNMEANERALAEERAAREAERQLKAKEAQEKLEKERLAREKEMKRLADERMAAEKELLEAQQAAKEGIQGATGTFATAGGAFTVGIDAQLNETKLMRSVSEKSRDILQSIKETLEKRQPEPLLM